MIQRIQGNWEENEENLYLQKNFGVILNIVNYMEIFQVK